MFSLQDKVAIVTGSSRGIGRATAVRLARAGARVVINYSSSKEKAEEVLAEIQGFDGEAIIIKANVADFVDAQNLVKKTLDEFNKIDILINNAGITRDNLLLRMKETEWDQVIDVNLKGVYNCTKAVTRTMMKQHSGKIINITSVVGVMGNAGQSNYAASKAGIIGFTKSIAKELSNRGIVVNAVAPGFILSDMTENLSQEVINQMLGSIPLNYFGHPEDVANLIHFLASNDANYINGQVIHVDGGMLM